MWHIWAIFFFQISLHKTGSVNAVPLIMVLILTELIRNAFSPPFFLNKYNFGYPPGLPSPKMATRPWCPSQTAMFPLVRPPRWARMTLTVWTGCTGAVSTRVNNSFLDCNMKMDCCWTWHACIHTLSLTWILPPVLCLSETHKTYTEITFCPEFRASVGFFMITKSTAEWQCW